MASLAEKILFFSLSKVLRTALLLDKWERTGCWRLQAVRPSHHVAEPARFMKYTFAGKRASSLLSVNIQTFPERDSSDLQKIKLCITNYHLTHCSKKPQLIHPLTYDGLILHLYVTFQLYDLYVWNLKVHEGLNRTTKRLSLGLKWVFLAQFSPFLTIV